MQCNAVQCRSKVQASSLCRNNVRTQYNAEIHNVNEMIYLLIKGLSLMSLVMTIYLILF